MSIVNGVTLAMLNTGNEYEVQLSIDGTDFYNSSNGPFTILGNPQGDFVIATPTGTSGYYHSTGLGPFDYQLITFDPVSTEPPLPPDYVVGCTSVGIFTSSGSATTITIGMIDNSSSVTTNLDAFGTNVVFAEVQLDTVTAFITTPCCIRGGATVITIEGPVPIKDVCDQTQVLTQDGDFVDVVYNIKHLVPTSKFYLLAKGILGKNQPHTDLYLTPGHPIIFEGQEIDIQDVPGAKQVELNVPEETYTLCTKDRAAVMTNGVGVMTWAQSEWEDSKPKLWTKN